MLQASLDALPAVGFGRGRGGGESEEESLIDFTQSPPTNLEHIKIPKIILPNQVSILYTISFVMSRHILIMIQLGGFFR